MLVRALMQWAVASRMRSVAVLASTGREWCLNQNVSIMHPPPVLAMIALIYQ